MQENLAEMVRQMTEVHPSLSSNLNKIAHEYEGVADLITLWTNEKDPTERKEIIADIQSLIDDCEDKRK